MWVPSWVITPPNGFYSSKYRVQESWWTWSSWSPTSWQTAGVQCTVKTPGTIFPPPLPSVCGKKCFCFSTCFVGMCCTQCRVKWTIDLLAYSDEGNLHALISPSLPISIDCLTVLPSCLRHASYKMLCYHSWTQWACGFAPKYEVRYLKNSCSSSDQGKDGKMASVSSAWHIFSTNTAVFRYDCILKITGFKWILIQYPLIQLDSKSRCKFSRMI